ncbi:glycoside hydrolase family 3 N-terminal domain-containing protein [Frankia nepalensis]|nr:glycoside hydrolase family 3 N-terminal domain-containing protein [Frankia nepalensis]
MLRTDLLRGRLRFEGIAVSDYDAVTVLTTSYHSAISNGRAAVQSISAGLGVELPGNTNFSYLAGEVAGGRLDERVIDKAVARVLTMVDGVRSIEPGDVISRHARDTSARPTWWAPS